MSDEEDPLGVGPTLIDDHGNEYYGTPVRPTPAEQAAYEQGLADGRLVEQAAARIDEARVRNAVLDEIELQVEKRFMDDRKAPIRAIIKDVRRGDSR